MCGRVRRTVSAVVITLVAAAVGAGVPAVASATPSKPSASAVQPTPTAPRKSTASAATALLMANVFLSPKATVGVDPDTRIDDPKPADPSGSSVSFRYSSPDSDVVDYECSLISGDEPVRDVPC